MYLLGRALVIRQESTDMQEEGVDYNVIKYNPFGSADFVNPNLDVGKRPSSERSSCTNDRDFPALPCSRFVTGHHVISDGHGTLRAPTWSMISFDSRWHEPTCKGE